MPDKFHRRRVHAGALWRAGADVLFVNTSIALALLARLLAGLFWQQRWAELPELRHVFAQFYFVSAPLLTALTLFIFNLFGVYNRTRFYARRSKALVLFQAVTLTYLLFLFSLYFISREIALVPRGVLALSFLLTLALSGGMRLLANFASDRYSIVARTRNGERELRRVLVVGGAGYIGSVLVRQLLERGYVVRVLDVAAFGSGSLDDVRDHPRFEFLAGDLRHVESVVRALQGSDAVVHLGAVVGDPACELDASSAREINTVATKMLVHVCRGFGVSRLLFASTCAVYGASDHLMDERSALNPVSTYAKSKADAEQIVLSAAADDFCPVVLRLGTAFGHSFRPRFDLVVNLLVARALKEGRITVFNPEQWRPFVHVHDIARAIVACLGAHRGAVLGEVFNVGDYRLNRTLGDVAGEVKAQIPEVIVEIRETPDRRNYRVSFDKIHSQLGFTAERTIADGVRELRSYLLSTSCDALAETAFDNAKSMKEGTVLTVSQAEELAFVDKAASPARARGAGA